MYIYIYVYIYILKILYYFANTINRMGRTISNAILIILFPVTPKWHRRHFVAKHYKTFSPHGVTFFPTRFLPKFQGSLRKNKPKICGIFLSIPRWGASDFSQLTPSDGMSFVPDMQGPEARLPSTGLVFTVPVWLCLGVHATLPSQIGKPINGRIKEGMPEFPQSVRDQILVTEERRQGWTFSI